MNRINSINKLLLPPTKLLITILFILLAGGKANAQEQIVTLGSRSISVRDALKEIEGQTQYLFALGHSNFDLSRVVVLSGRRMSVKSVLDELLAESGRTYRMDGKEQILIIPKRLDKQQEKNMVVLPFDWSKSYSDADFARDAVEDARRREARPEEEIPEPIIEVTVITDSVFTYPSHTFYLPQRKDPGLNWVRTRDGAGYFAVKTNVLHGALAFAPNIAAEFGVSPHSTIDIAYGANYWNKDGSYNDNKKLIHWYLRPEYRYWLCNRFNGHFFGLHAFYWQYNVSQHDIPLLFDKKYQYEGNAYGAGVSYGYHLVLGKRWGVEFNAGVGVAFMKYDKYGCAKCGDWIENASKTYFGPTSLGIKLVYMIK